MLRWQFAAIGLRISAVANVSMVDVCRIVPFSEGYDDTLTNGIALCPNLYRAFNKGLISVSDDYAIFINKNFVENKNWRVIFHSLQENKSFYRMRRNCILIWGILRGIGRILDFK
jgi:putative restriction endonuclease